MTTGQLSGFSNFKSFKSLRLFNGFCSLTTLSALAACAVSLSVASTAQGQSCAGDLNIDGVVNGGDLVLLLSGWENCGC
jgi:hypothetical protein